MNETELLRLAGWSQMPEDDPRPLLEHLREATGVNRWCVTLGAKGAWWWDGPNLLRAESPMVTVRDTVGAGDAFVAALVDGLTCGDKKNGPEKIQKILTRACRLGALVASREGACPEYQLQEIE
jgi:fructokinase